MALTAKQNIFVVEYLKDKNATRAAKAAGYSFSNNTNKYYVYMLVDPRSNEIFYVGKGKGQRVLHHERLVKNGHLDNPFKCNVIRDILKSGYEVCHYIFASNLTENDAYTLEKNLINGIGIELLTNIDKGQLGEHDKVVETAKFWLSKVIDFEEWKLTKNPCERDIELYHFVINGLKTIVAGNAYA